jgi:hypothetical protein
MGIMILVMLVIALELAARQLESPVIQQAIVRQDVREALTLATEKLEQVKRALAAGAWDNLAALNRDDVQRQTSELERLLPILEQNAQHAEQRLVQVHQRQEQAEQAFEERNSDEESLRSLKEELAALEEELSRVTTSSAMFFRPSQTGGKLIWLVEVSGDAILAAPLGPSAKPLSFAGSSGESRQRQFLAWATQRDSSREYFVLLIKPGGARLCNEIERELRSKLFDVGLDLIGSKQTPIDLERGAPIVPGENREGL